MSSQDNKTKCHDNIYELLELIDKNKKKLRDIDYKEMLEKLTKIKEQKETKYVRITFTHVSLDFDGDDEHCLDENHYQEIFQIKKGNNEENWFKSKDFSERMITDVFLKRYKEAERKNSKDLAHLSKICFCRTATALIHKIQDIE